MQDNVTVQGGEPSADQGVGGFDQSPRVPMVKKKKKRKKLPIIIAIAVSLLLIAGIVSLILWSGKKEPNEIMNDYVVRGTITSQVEGHGLTKAKKSETITVTTSGTVLDVYVNEGDFVTAGTPLYLIDSPAAQEAVTAAQREVEGYQKQLRTLYEARSNLNIYADFAGKLIEVKELKKGEEVGSGELIARLVDDSKLKLTQYYSYAYEHEVYVGQVVQVSIPSAMEQLSGAITEIKKVERISPEGSRLFRVDIVIDNPGTLTEKLVASATISTGTETISPYEQSELTYFKETQVKTKVSGEVTQFNVQNYQKVSAGALVLKIKGDDNDTEIFTAEENLTKAQKDLEKAKENRENLQGVAPIDGLVSLGVTRGQEIPANTVVASVLDESQILVEAKVDERSIRSVKVGDVVELTQSDVMSTGVVESVSLQGKFENGMTSFPIKILADNPEGILMSGASVTYKLAASKREDCLMLQLQSVKSVSDPETGEAINVVFVKTDVRPDNAIDVDGSALGVPPTGYFAVPVEIGLSDNYNVEIISGLEEMQEVFSQVIKQDDYYGFY